MLRSEIRLIEFGEAMPSESAYRRPAVIVSNDGANTTAARLGRGVITVVPLTSNVATIYPFQILIAAEVSGLDRDSKAQAEQIRSISIERVGDRLGSLPAPLMLELDEAMRLHLSL